MQSPSQHCKNYSNGGLWLLHIVKESVQDKWRIKRREKQRESKWHMYFYEMFNCPQHAQSLGCLIEGNGPHHRKGSAVVWHMMAILLANKAGLKLSSKPHQTSHLHICIIGLVIEPHTDSKLKDYVNMHKESRDTHVLLWRSCLFDMSFTDTHNKCLSLTWCKALL